MTTPALSIIVPTSLGRIPWPLLHSIKEQSLDSNLFEIILVFNGKKKPANTVPMTNAHLLYSPLKGVNHARNLGILHARGEILLFLDDDCRLTQKNYLSSMLELHRTHPQQMSMGGPYVLPVKSSWLARAYHHNQSEWLRAQMCGPQHSKALLGGNASYKKQIFIEGLRFSPGIVYGGSETPLNTEVLKKFGPHGFYQELSLEHMSRLTPWTFIKKAYLQGKGSAFQKKFYNTLAASTLQREHLSPLLRILLWIYDFCFMMGYRTSIYERRYWWASLGEEFFQRISAPFQPIVSDVKAAKHMAFSAPAPLFSPASPASPRETSVVPANATLFTHLQNMSENDLHKKAIELPTSSRCDAVYDSLNKISSYFGIAPETLSFANTHRTPAALTTHNRGGFVFVFCPDLSENYLAWSRERVEASSIKGPVTYLYSESAAATKNIWPHKLHPTFYPLDGVAMHKDVWLQYLSTTADPMNHFSWNRFVQAKLPPPQRTAAKVGASPNIKTLSQHAKTAFLNQPSRVFYQEHMVLLGQNHWRRSFLLRVFLWISQITNHLPSSWTQAFSLNMQGLQARISHWHLETRETSSLFYKWMAYALHRTYWFLHKVFWTLSEVYWCLYKIVTFTLAQLVWRSFDVAIFMYMFFNTAYWRLHVVFIGPALGFLASLFEEPPHFKNLPLSERYKQRALLFLRKWAWLFLRGARLR